MMKLRERLGELHKVLSESHGRQAEHQATLTEHFTKLAEQLLKAAEQDQAAAHLTAIAETHHKLHVHYSEMGAVHEALSEEYAKVTSDLEKSAGDEMQLLERLIDQRVDKALGDQTLPPPMSRVAPPMPTLVPRAGSPTPAGPMVPLEFASLVAIDES